MPQIINPYANQKTMGDDLFGLGGVAEAFFGPKASTAAYTREKFKEQQRQNLGVEDLAALMQTPGADPGALTAAAVRGGVPHGDLGGFNLFNVAGRNLDPASPQVLQAQTMAKVPYSQTATGDAADQAMKFKIAEEQTRRAVEKELAIQARTLVPVRGADGKIVYQRTADAAGQGFPTTFDQARGSAVVDNWSNLGKLDPFQRNIINADVPNQNWFAPGNLQGRVDPFGNDVATGRPLLPNAVTSSASNPGGSNAYKDPNQPTTSNIGKIQEGMIAGQTAIDLGNDIMGILNKDPTVAGFTGQAQRFGQNALDIMGGVRTMMGGGRLEANIKSAQDEVLASVPGAASVLPELFNPNLNEVTTLYGFMAFKVAKSFNQGGPVTKADLEAAKATMGDPTSWTSGPQGVRTSMAKTVELLQRQQDRNAQLLKSMNVTETTATQPRPTATAAPVDRTAVDNALKLYGGTP